MTMQVLAAAAALAVLALAAGGGSTASPEPAATPAATPAAKRRAVLMPIGAGNPFRVRGSGFRARELVRVTITETGSSRITRRIRASRRGTFVLAFRGVRACGGVKGTAAGSRGSRASFQFSSFTCSNDRPPY
jgi:hypothetical protein